MMPLRRMRVQFLLWHNPPCWAAYYELPGKVTCYCHADTLIEMMKKIADYYAGRGEHPPLRVEERLAKHLRPNERYGGLTEAGRAALGRSEG